MDGVGKEAITVDDRLCCEIVDFCLSSIHGENSIKNELLIAWTSFWILYTYQWGLFRRLFYSWSFERNCLSINKVHSHTQIHFQFFFIGGSHSANDLKYIGLKGAGVKVFYRNVAGSTTWQRSRDNIRTWFCWSDTDFSLLRRWENDFKKREVYEFFGLFSDESRSSRFEFAIRH